jgi:hypothetical protein
LPEVLRKLSLIFPLAQAASAEQPIRLHPAKPHYGSVEKFGEGNMRRGLTLKLGSNAELLVNELSP